MIEFSQERLSDVWDEVMGIAREHWYETEEYRHGQEFNPDKERYLSYSEIGFLRLYTARSQGVLIGYAVMYISPSMHTQKMIATEDTWFLKTDYRRGRNAIRFYNYVESQVLKHGVVEIMMSAKLVNSSGKIMEYLGYSHVANSYSKQFTENEHVRPKSTATA